MVDEQGTGQAVQSPPVPSDGPETAPMPVPVAAQDIAKTSTSRGCAPASRAG